jgi:hypothetical protein
MIKNLTMFSLKIYVILEAHIHRLVSQTTREVLHVYMLKDFRFVSLYCSTRKHDFSCDKMAKRQSYYLAKKKTNSRILQRSSEENIHYWGNEALSSCVYPSLCPQSILHKLWPYRNVNILENLKGEGIFHSNKRNSAGNGSTCLSHI